MAGSKKPYPCCGKDPGYGRPAAEVVCYDCRALISLGKAYKQHMSGALEEPETILVKAPAERDWDCPRFYTRHSHGDPFTAIGQMLKRLIFTLAVKATHHDSELGDGSGWRQLERVDLVEDAKKAPEAFHISPGTYGNGWNSTEPILINKENKELLEELIRAIDVALKKSEAAGVEYGRHQLKQLVEGEITVSELSEAT